MENDMEKAALMALNRIFGYAPRAGKALLEQFGRASDIFSADRDTLRGILGPVPGYLDRLVPKELEESFREMETLRSCGAEFIGIGDTSYPDRLADCPDPPLGLYCKSSAVKADLNVPAFKIGIVGTRDMSSYGRQWCTLIVRAFARAKPAPAIVSGLAFGIDCVAHTAALDCGLPTMAVMATGIDDVYPYRHIPLAGRIASSGQSALLTDYPCGTQPKPVNFLRRNRIIAGISDAVVLVESRAKGGGMITARLASEYNRDVYALPGRLDDIRSEGCNLLIREKVAETVTDPDDLVRRIGLTAGKAYAQKTLKELLSEYYEGIPEEDFALLEKVATLVRDNRGATIDELAARSGIAARTIAQTAGMLETDGIISIDMIQRCSFNSKLL